jgi:TolB-like protein/Tfp pilus assembly protein PilF
MGTVNYMSPEQSAGKEVDHRTDIWSLGVVLYEMIAGVIPFQGKDIHRQIITIQEQEPAPLSQQVEGVPDRLEVIVGKCLAKEKDERYQTAKDLLIDLRNLRRKLDLDAEIERTVAPDTRAEPANKNQTQVYGPGSVAATGSSHGTATHSGTTSASSLEYAVTQAKSHKLVTATIAVLLVAGIAAAGYFALVSNGGSTKQIGSIAVMPFVNEGGNAELEYLSDGMTETLIKSLSQLPNLSVKARSSVFRYKGKMTDAKTIGKELGVQAILNGRVVQRADRLALSLELIDAQTENVLWSEQYNRGQTDLISLQSEIARDVSAKLRSKLSGADEAKVVKTYTANPEAYQLYLKGRFVWNKRTGEALKQAIEFYKQAIEKDPNYALAYSGLAETYVLFSSYSVALAKDSMPLAKAAAQRALELDDSLAEAHTALAEYLNHYEFDHVGSEREFRRAIELNPNYATARQWFGNLLVELKRFDEGLVELRRAEELDPLSPIIGTNLGDALLYARRYDEAIAHLRRVLSLYPDFAIVHFSLATPYAAKGMYPEAIAELRKYLELDPDPTGKGCLGFYLAKSGRRDEALKLLNELKQESSQRYVQSMAFAYVYVGLGDKEEAYVWLEREISERGSNARYFAVFIELDELRSEPRFKDMLKRMNLPE